MNSTGESLTMDLVAIQVATYLLRKRVGVPALKEAIRRAQPLLADALREEITAERWAAAPAEVRASIAAWGDAEVVGFLNALKPLLPMHAVVLFQNPNYLRGQMAAAKVYLQTLGSPGPAVG